MSDELPAVRTNLLPLIPRVPVSVRVATRAEVPFIDALQKAHGKALGFFPTQQLLSYIDGGHVLVAEEVWSGELGVGREDRAQNLPALPTPHSQLPTPLGYLIYRDRYLKRDELGVIFQLCVSPAGRRKLVGARLVQAAFERSPRGTKLFCCWCAQDLAANRFWESLGFQPIAFRTGGRKSSVVGRESSSNRPTTHHSRPTRSRIHLFWQMRIRDRQGGDDTPWWYPSETGGGAIREDRLVLPIPPGTRWEDVLPAQEKWAEDVGKGDEPVRNVGKVDESARSASRRESRLADSSSLPTHRADPLGRPQFAAKKVKKAKRVPAEREKRVSRKNDPAFARQSRELRDAWVEMVKAHPEAVSPANGKYAITARSAAPLPAPASMANPATIALLPAA